MVDMDVDVDADDCARSFGDMVWKKVHSTGKIEFWNQPANRKLLVSVEFQSIKQQ